MISEVFFVEVADQMEQLGTAWRRERQIAQLIENDGIHMLELLGEVAGFTLLLSLSS